MSIGTEMFLYITWMFGQFEHSCTTLTTLFTLFLFQNMRSNVVTMLLQPKNQTARCFKKLSQKH